jgi:predicted transcriptional regulator
LQTFTTKRARILYDTLLKLAADDPNGVVRTAMTQLAKNCGIAYRTVKAAVNDLVTDGLITVMPVDSPQTRSRLFEFRLIERRDLNFKP